MDNKTIKHLKELEAESIYVLREVAAQFERPVILFSGGKDSIVITYLAYKAFYPAKIPFPLLHIDTGHNFEETILYRDELVKKLGAELIVGSVQESIDKGRVKEETGYYASRNKLQTTTLLDTLEEYKFDAAIGGARRDEEKPVPRNDSSVIVTNSDNGTRRTSARNSGTSSTAERTWASTSVCSLSPTGPRWMYGSISSWRTSRCLRSTSPTKERYSTVTDNGSQPCLASSASLQRKW